MPLPRFAIFASILLAAGPAAAQTIQPQQGFQPAPAPQQQGFQPAPQAAPARQEPPCFKDFIALRTDAEKKGKAVQTAGQRKAPPQEACRLLTALVAAENKLVKFSEDNSAWCGIPSQVVTTMKEQHKHTGQIRDRVCQFASRPQGPAAPTLSDALGTNRVPDAKNIRTGRGTFDTLTGTPLGSK
jgi:hypothetical protein